MGPLIECRAVRKRFGRKQVLDGVDLTVDRGEIVVLMGPSGSGKTLLIRLLVGLSCPDDGDVRFADTSLLTLDGRALRAFRRRMGYVFQGSALFDSMSVGDNVGYALYVEGVRPQRRIDERVRDCLQWVGLHDIERLQPQQLSGGMQKRVAIARALASQPEALFYDEPTLGLDRANIRRVAKVIEQLKARLRTAALVVTHDRDFAFDIGDRIALLQGGRLVWVGSVERARADPPPILRAFLAGETLEEDVP